jgi:hypothetical protein
LSTLKIIAVFRQIGDIYNAPNHTFLYDRSTISTRSSPSLSINKLDQKIHIGMMTVLVNDVDEQDALFTEIASNEQTSTSVLQIRQTDINDVSLTKESEIEVNLIKSDQKDTRIAPAIVEDAQEEAADDSEASSTLIGFRDVCHDCKEQSIPIRTAGAQFTLLA